jgi:hypothetical protein
MTKAPDTKRIAEVLLGTMAGDAPSARAKRNALAAFGAVSAVTAVASSSAAGATSATASALAASETIASTALGSAGAASTGAAVVAGKVATSVGILALTKAIVLGALAGGVTVYAGDRWSTPTALRSEPMVPPSAVETPKTGRPPFPSGAQSPIGPPLTNVPPTGSEPTSALSDDVPLPADERVRAMPAPSRFAVDSDPSRPATPAHAAARRVQTASPLVPAPAPSPAVSVAGGASAPESTVPQLARETRRLDRARLALRTAAPKQALQEIAAYEAEFPSGNLQPEATVLHVEALMQMGDEAAARAVASAFASAYPTSGHLPKILHLLAGKRSP